jgi:integrating conjugative element protein (TIGR03765 family)
MKMLSFFRSFLFTGLLSALLFPALTAAALHVIADVGGADAAPFFGSINRLGDTPQTLSPVAAPGQDEASMLPVTTPALTPGAVSDRPLQLPGIGALFLVGEDPDSQVWLARNAAVLAERHAIGMVVNVTVMANLQTLRELAPGVEMAPASGSELARRLRLDHYPVLITDTGLSSRVGP